MINIKENDIFKYNLEQGKSILNYNDKIDEVVKPHLNLIQQGSIIEGLDGSRLSLKDKKIVEGLQNIENEFNKTIVKYNQVYKQFSEDLMKKQNQLNKISPYLGKNVRVPDGGIFYVNKFGNYYWYNSTQWNERKIGDGPEECPDGYDDISTDNLNKMTRSVDMNVGGPCRVAGQVVKENTESGDLAWVDIKGYKHSFPRGTNMSSSCAQRNIINLSKTSYDAIPSGNSMSSIDPCTTLDINPTIWKELNQLNNKLKMQAAAITKEINSLSTQDLHINKKLLKSRNRLNSYINKIENDKLLFINNKEIMVTAEGEQEDSELRMTSNYYFLLIWVVFTFLIISLSVSAYASDSKNVKNISYIIIAVFMLIFVVYLYNKVVVSGII